MIHMMLYPSEAVGIPGKHDVTLSKSAPGIVIMVKAPRPGTVKTRLGSCLTPEDAAALAACGVRDVVRTAKTVAPFVLIAYTPLNGQNELQELLPDQLLWTPQQGADLGARMHSAVAAAALQGLKPVVVLGTDSPTFPPEAVAEAFTLLQNHDVVLGPAEDGGYWCVGLREPQPPLFDDILWSTEVVFEQTTANARRLGLTVATVAAWYDTDTPDDLARLENDPFLQERAPETAAWFSSKLSRQRAFGGVANIDEAALESGRGNTKPIADPEADH